MATTQDSVAPETPNRDQQYNAPSAKWQIGGVTPIAALNAARAYAAGWAGTFLGARSNVNRDPICRNDSVLHDKSAGNEA
jgi:hypothetical protein